MPDINWNLNSGMAASSNQKDYIHILVKKLALYKKELNFYCNIKNLASFEREPDKFDLCQIEDILKEKNYNLIIFQLGDNMNSKNINKLKVNYEKLINLIIKHSKESIKIMTVPFFSEINKQRMILKIAKKLNIKTVDLSIISKLNCSKALYDNKYNHTGIDMHPGDFGMEIIANELFIGING